MSLLKQVGSVEQRHGELLWTCVLFWFGYISTFFTTWCVWTFSGSRRPQVTGLDIFLLIFFALGFLLPLAALMVTLLALAGFPLARYLLGEREVSRVRAVFLLAAVSAGVAVGGWPPAYVVTAAGPCIFVSACLLCRVAFAPSRRDVIGFCGKCGYDLTGNESGTCPECGQLIASDT